MKFEHILQIYWSKGFLISGKLQNFQTSFKYMFDLTGGYSYSMKKLLISRFEMSSLIRNPDQSISQIYPTLPQSLNKMFSEITSVNNTVEDLTRFNLIKLYLIKTTRGKSHALGKPSRGQRTWSNAWTAYHHNKVTRTFVSTYQKIRAAAMKEEKINYKLIKKKSDERKQEDTVTKVKIKVNIWF